MGGLGFGVQCWETGLGIAGLAGLCMSSRVCFAVPWLCAGGQRRAAPGPAAQPLCAVAAAAALKC